MIEIERERERTPKIASEESLHEIERDIYICTHIYRERERKRESQRQLMKHRQKRTGHALNTTEIEQETTSPEFLLEAISAWRTPWTCSASVNCKSL